MIKLDIKVKEEAISFYRTKEIGSEFELKVTSFKKLYKGTIEVDLKDKLKESIKEGYITLRGHERLLVGTGVAISLPQDIQLLVMDTTANALKKGLVVSNTIINHEYRGEIGLVITNNTPFLNKVHIGDVIATAILKDSFEAMWITE